MTALLAASLAAQVAAATTGILLAQRRPEHRPAAVALVLLVAAPLTGLPLLAALHPLPRPVMGMARALVYLDGARVLVPMAVIPGLAMAISLDRPRRAVAAVAAAWLLGSIVLAALYPSELVRGASLARVYLAADLAGLVVSIAAWARWGSLHRSPTAAHLIFFALVIGDLAILLVPHSPWREGLFAADFDGVRFMVLLMFSVVAVFQGILWRFSPRS